MKKFISILIVLLLSTIIFSNTKSELDLETLIKKVLNNNTTLKSSLENVNNAYAQIYGANAVFDPHWTIFTNVAEDNSPLTNSQKAFYKDGEYQEKTNSYGVNFSQNLENGINISSQISYQKKNENSLPSETKTATSSLDFKLEIPIVAGSGRVTTLNRKISQKMYKASLYDYERTVSGIILQSIVNFWKKNASEKTLEIVKRSENSMKQTKSDTIKLINAKQIPEAEINKIEAAIFQKDSERLYAETSLFQETQNLLEIMNLDIKTFDTIKLKDYSFVMKDKPEFSKDTLNETISIATENRRDLKASKLRLDAAKDNLKKIEDSRRENIMLSLQSGFKGLSEGEDAESLTKAWSDNKTEYSYSLSLIHTFSVRDNYNNSEYLKAITQKNLAQISYEQKIRTVEKEAAISLKEMVNAWKIYNSSKRSMEYSKNSLYAEKKKFNLGLSTILDVIDVEERHNQIERNVISNETQFISAFLKYLHTTGKLLEKNKDKNGFRIDLSKYFITESFNEGK